MKFNPCLLVVCGAVVACGGEAGSNRDSERDARAVWADADAEARLHVQTEVQASLAARHGAEVSVSVADCNRNMSAAQLTQELSIALELEQQLSQLGASGSVSIDTAELLKKTLLDLLLKPASSERPQGLQHDADGSYVAIQSGSSRLEVRLWTYMKQNEQLVLVTDDLFDIDSYLVNAKLDADADLDVDIDWSDPFDSDVDVSADVHIDYTKPGPFAPLLGFGNPPPRPLVLSPKLIASFDPNLQALHLGTEIRLSTEHSGFTVMLTAESEPQTLPELVKNQRVPLRFNSLKIENKSLNQTLTLTETGATLTSTGDKRLDGNIEFQVEGSQRFSGKLQFRNSTQASVSLNCER